MVEHPIVEEEQRSGKRMTEIFEVMLRRRVRAAAHDLGIRYGLAPRSSEERFLDCVAQLVRKSERGRKGRATPLGMTGGAVDASNDNTG
jgi:hypothetical protein